jgi:transposase InsO family protein
VYFIKNKSETFAKLIEFRTLVERQTEKPMKMIRTDGGGEYVNDDMKEYLTKHGIRHEITVPYNPEQNGVAERYNRMMIERVRAMMHSGGIPKDLWAEIARTAVYLCNRKPS